MKVDEPGPYPAIVIKSGLGGVSWALAAIGDAAKSAAVKHMPKERVSELFFFIWFP